MRIRLVRLLLLGDRLIGGSGATHLEITADWNARHRDIRRELAVCVEMTPCGTALR
jgi:hypothetical protein